MSCWIKNKLTPIVKNICNKYFSNFKADSFHFELGWTGNGDVQLDDLVLRTDVLDQFDLPVKVSYGVIGSLHAGFGVLALTMGTPDVVVAIKDIYLVLSQPESEPYSDPDPVLLRVKKQKSIQDAEKKLAEGILSDSDRRELSLILGVINNIKIVCENIHLRYEDDITTPRSPFSFGLTLKELYAVSANDNYEEATTNKTSKTFFKVVKIKDFGIYWNSNSEIIRPQIDSEKDVVKTLNRMKNLLHGKTNNKLDFILGPMKSKIHAMVTMKPQSLDKPFSKPKAKVELVLEGLDIQLENEQYRDFLLFGDSLEANFRRKPYLKFRPYRTPVKRHAKRWWKYAYFCVKQNIVRKNKISDINFLKEKYRLCKAYETAYLKVIQNPSPSKKEKNAALELEDKLTVPDIIAVRRKQEFYKVKLKEVARAKSNWHLKYVLSAEEINKILNTELSPEDKKQLKARLDLQFEDDGKEINYPEGYVEIKFNFNLPNFNLKIFEVHTKKEIEILRYTAKNFFLSVETLPGQKGLRAEITMKDLSVTGIGKQAGALPSIARAIIPTPDTDFLAVKFEKNPSNTKSALFVRIDIQPLEIIYDSFTMQKLVECFTWPAGVDLAETTATVKALMKDAQNITSEGIETLVKEQASMDLDLTIRAPYFLIPEGGDYSKKNADILAINLGNILVHSSPREHGVPDPKTLSDHGLGGSHGTNVSSTVLKLTYNNFAVKLQNIEVFMALGGENILAAINHEYLDDGEYHYYQPLALVKTGEFVMDLNRCIVKNDPRFPNIKGSLTIPTIGFDITDYRLQQLVKLLVTMPIPQSAPAPSALLNGELDRENFTSFDLDLISIQDLKVNKKEVIVLDAEIKELYDKINADKDEDGNFDSEKSVQYTKILWNLVLDRIEVNLMLLIGEHGPYSSVEPILDFQLINLQAEFLNRTFGTSLDISIQSITSEYIGAKVGGIDGPIYLLYSPEAAAGQAPFLACHFFTISPKCPKSTVGSIKQKIDVNLSSLVITLHQESLGVLLNIVDGILNEYQESNAKKAPPPPKAIKRPGIGKLSSKKGMVHKLRDLRKNNRENPDDILTKVTGLASGITVEITSEAKKIATAKLAKIVFDIEEKSLQMKIFTEISGLEVTNLDRVTKFPHVVSIGPQEKFVYAEITIYKSKKKGDLDPDMNLKLLILCPKIVLQTNFMKNITDFLMELETPRKISWRIPKELRMAVKKVYGKHDPKILMHVQFKGLKILLLRNDESNEALVWDIPIFSIKNSLAIKETGDPKHNAVIDTLIMTIENLKAAKGLICVESQDIQGECYMVPPITKEWIVTRNLSFAWFDKVPRNILSGLSEPTVFKFSVHDIGLMVSRALDFAHQLITETEASFSTTGLPPCH